MNNQPSLTIVSITGHQGYAQSSAYAIEHSFEELKTQISNLKCLLISPERPADCPDYIQHIPCKPFGYFEYNLFCLYKLGQVIETDFALIVQHDGWVINGDKWQDKFFEYDFIGAPTLNLAQFEGDEFITRLDAEEWLKYWDNMPKNLVECQNGGLCLRSRKLLNILTEQQIPWTIQPLEPYQGGILELGWNEQSCSHVEDIFLSGYLRRKLENLGIKFAPTSVAAEFSIDRVFYHLQHNINLDNVLGWHGRQLYLTGRNKVLSKIQFKNKEEIDTNYFVQKLSQKGFSITGEF